MAKIDQFSDQQFIQIVLESNSLSDIICPNCHSLTDNYAGKNK